jgi:hypothetical protein
MLGTSSMQTGLESLAPQSNGHFHVAVTGPRAIAMRGQLDVRDPVAEVGPWVRKIHDAVAGGGGDLVIDLTELGFVNSSGLRIFLDWLAWLTAESPERRYRLCYRISAGSSWQAAAFPAIEMLGGDLVAIERV